MRQSNLVLYLILFIGTVSMAQDKVPTVTFGIERGMEINKKHDLSVESSFTTLKSNNSHNYWRLYVGIPFRFPKFKIDAGLGFSSNRFFRSLVVSSGGFPEHNYSGIGIDYFIKIPLGIGEDRFDMGTEFRHQLLMTNGSGGQSNIMNPTQITVEGRVKNRYISLGAYANYMVLMQDQIELGLNTSLGFSTFKYHDTFFQSTNLSFYINFGMVFYMYKSPKK